MPCVCLCDDSLAAAGRSAKRMQYSRLGNVLACGRCARRASHLWHQLPFKHRSVGCLVAPCEHVWPSALGCAVSLMPQNHRLQATSLTSCALNTGALLQSCPWPSPIRVLRVSVCT